MSLLKRVFSAAEITGVATQYSSCEIVGPHFRNPSADGFRNAFF